MRLRAVAIRLGIACLALIAVAASASAQCPALNIATAINVRVVEPKITYHHDIDLFGLPKLERSAERPPPGWTMLGLTKISDTLRTEFQLASVALPDGRVCVWLARVDARLGDPIMNIYVASEYEPGSCEYETILAHENTHVRFNLETLRDWMPSIRAALVESARRRFPAIYPGAPNEAALRERLLENLYSVFDLMNDDMRRRNATIDTPENYRRENAKCRHWSRHGLSLDR